MRRTKPTLIYRRTKNLLAVQLLLGHTKLARRGGAETVRRALRLARLDVVADIHRALAGRQERQRTQCQCYAAQGDRAAVAFAGFSGLRATPSKVFQSVAWGAAAAGRFVGAGY